MSTETCGVISGELQNALRDLEFAKAAFESARENLSSAKAALMHLAPFSPGELVKLRAGVDRSMPDGGAVYIDTVEWWGSHFRYSISRQKKDGAKHPNLGGTCQMMQTDFVAFSLSSEMYWRKPLENRRVPTVRVGVRATKKQRRQ